MNATILLVEDDPQALKTLAAIIAFHYPDVTLYSAENGAQGLELSGKHPPDIVISDFRMPVMDGLEMATKIKAQNEEVRFILITAYSEPVHLEQFKELGLCEYLFKPLDFKKLFSAIERCLSGIGSNRG